MNLKSFSVRLLCGSLLLLLAGTAVFLLCHPGERWTFHRITNDLFIDEMSENTLNMHYTIAYPEDFGISDYEPVLPSYSALQQQEAISNTELFLADLQQIDSSLLTEQDAYIHKLLIRSLEISLAQSDYRYYEEPLSPSSGMQTQLPILLAEYTFRQVRDVEDYFSLLDQTDEYLNSLLLYEQEKADAGLFMSADSLHKVLEQCDTIITSDELDAETHFLQSTFSDRLSTLLHDNQISAQQAESYTVQHNRLLKTVLLPAYEALSDGLFLLEDSTRPLAGLAANPDGKSYYETLLIAETGSYRPIPEIKSLLIARLQEEYKAIQSIVTATPQIRDHFQTQQHIELPYETAASILTDLQTRMATQFPSLHFDDTSTPAVSIKTLTANMEAYCAPAFYLTTPIDDTDTNVIYINPKYTPEGLDLYTTLAHEGYPGHLYQTVYNNRCFSANGENNIRQLLWYGGYLEGWALYVEFLSFDYASMIMKEENRQDDAICIQLEKHNRSLQLCLFSILDIMIHYENASSDQITQILRNFGINDPGAAEGVFTYIAEEPCNYLKYYLGYLEILELQKAARTSWGSSYSDYAFHSFYLDSGPSDFTSLSERLSTFSPTATP